MTMTTLIDTRAISVVMVIFTVENDQLHVLLIRRSAEPAKGSWSLPGGLLGNSKSLEAAAIRKLQDETGLSDVFLEQLYTFTDLDKRGSIAIAYFALVDSGQARLPKGKHGCPPGSPSAPYLLWPWTTMSWSTTHCSVFEPNWTIPMSPTASCHRSSAYPDCRASMRRSSTDPWTSGNFRKRILSLGIIEPTGRMAAEGAHRPAQLYKFRERRPVIF